jgi:hypothetical protein
MQGIQFAKKVQTQEEIDHFIELIEYNRSQRNQNKDFLMEKFMDGEIFLKEKAIGIANIDQPEGTKMATLLLEAVKTTTVFFDRD